MVREVHNPKQFPNRNCSWEDLLHQKPNSLFLDFLQLFRERGIRLKVFKDGHLLQMKDAIVESRREEMTADYASLHVQTEGSGEYVNYADTVKTRQPVRMLRSPCSIEGSPFFCRPDLVCY